MRTTWRLGIMLAVGLVAFGLPASIDAATPAIWDLTLGAELTPLTGTDDADQSITLSFDFPFAGNTYRTLYVSTNGEVHTAGDAITAPRPDGSDLLEADGPILAPFWGDLSQLDRGSVYVKDFGNRAVITWFKTGSYENGAAPFTFQAQLLSDGRIIFGYNGISDLTNKLASDLVVGISSGSGALPDARDLSAAPLDSSAESTVYEAFAEGQGVFDLDNTNLVFTPNSSGGWTVAKTTTLPPPPGPVTLCNDATPPSNFTCSVWFQDDTQFCPYQTYPHRIKVCQAAVATTVPPGCITATAFRGYTCCSSAATPAGTTCGAAYTGTLYCPTQTYKYRDKDCTLTQ